MESNKGIIALIVFCLILAVAGVALVTRSGRGKAASGPDRPPALARPPAPPAPIPAMPGQPPGPAEQVDSFQTIPQPPQDLETGRKPDPRLVVSPVDEPVVLLYEKVSEREDFVAPLPNGGGFIFERRDEKGRKVGGVVVPGMILQTRGMVELFGCGEGGKEHETVLRLECDVQSLDLALTSAGFNRGRLSEKYSIDDPDQGSRVLILVQWEDKDGKTVTYRSEDLVVSVRRERPMPRVGWTYVAPWAEMPDPTSPSGEKKNKVLAAAHSRSYVTTFRDRATLLDNPLEEAIDDTLFAANYMLLPHSGTPVRVIFRMATEAERKEIAGLERAIAKEPKREFKHGRHQEDVEKPK